MARARIHVLMTNKLASPPLHCALSGVRGFYDQLDEILELVDLFMNFFFFWNWAGLRWKDMAKLCKAWYCTKLEKSDIEKF